MNLFVTKLNFDTTQDTLQALRIQRIKGIRATMKEEHSVKLKKGYLAILTEPDACDTLQRMDETVTAIQRIFQPFTV